MSGTNLRLGDDAGKSAVMAEMLERFEQEDKYDSPPDPSKGIKQPPHRAVAFLLVVDPGDTRYPDLAYGNLTIDPRNRCERKTGANLRKVPDTGPGKVY